MAAASLSLSACLAQPFDGQRIAARTSTLQVAGVHVRPAGRVDVLAMNAATGEFERVGTSTASTTRLTSFGGVDWYEWSTSVVLGDSFWTPGSRGSFARLRAETADGGIPFSLTALQEGWADCVVRQVSERWTEITRECSAVHTPMATICTDDFIPMGRRRGPCPRRTVDALGAAGRILRRYPLPDETITIVDGPFPVRIAWRGDAMSFIDVFDVDLASPGEARRLGTHGATSGNFVRLRYPHPTDSRSFSSFHIDSLATGLPPRARWGGAVSFRQYDPGECSGFLSWREVLASVAETLDASIANALAGTGSGMTARTDSRISLTPILRSGSAGDAVRLGVAIHLRKDGFEAGRAILGTTIGFTATGGTLTGRAEKVDVTLTDVALTVLGRLLGAPDRAATEAMFAARVRAAVPGLVADSLPPILRAIHVHRVYGRPDGIEVVIAESQDEDQFATANSLGFCERPNPDSSPPVAGHFDVVFDPPLPTDPPVFGNPL